MAKASEVAEGIVLGSLMVSPESISKVVALFEPLGEKVFYNGQYRLIYRSILQLSEQGKPTDPPSVYLKLQEQKKKVPQKDIADLTSQAVGSAGIELWAKEIKELALEREFQEFTEQLTKKEGGMSLANRVEEAYQGIVKFQKEASPEKVGISAWESLHRPKVDNPSPIGGGLLFPQRFIIIGADDGEGKTTLCLQLALSVVLGLPFLGRFPVKKPAKVLYFCGENSDLEINAKLELQLDKLKSLKIKNIEQALKERLTLIYPEKIDFFLDKPADIPLIAYWLMKYKAEIVIFDGLNRFVSGGESLSGDIMARAVGTTLNELARKYSCYPVLTTHLKKRTKNDKGKMQQIDEENVFQEFHGSGYWTRLAISEVAIIRAYETQTPLAKKIVFKCKNLGEPFSMLMLRPSETLWLGEKSFDEISKAKLTVKDLVEVLKRCPSGETVPSVFIERVCEELGCGKRTAWELYKVAKERGLIEVKNRVLYISGEIQEKLNLE